MAHICLINPPGIKTTSGLQMHTPNPPIGLAYIAAAVRQAGHRVTVIDATGEALNQIAPLTGREDILVQGLTSEQVVARIPPDTDVIGLGCMFSTLWPVSREILKAVHAARPELPIILGGEHPSAAPEHAMTESHASICVLGEGEDTVVELLNVLSNNGDLQQVHGIAFRAGADSDASAQTALQSEIKNQKSEIIRTPARARTKAVDDIPLPAWDLFPVEQYIDRHQMNGIHQGRAMPILGTRGCPYRCTFCSSPQMWTTTYTMRDVAKVSDEIELYMQRYGATDFHFQDLTAIVSRKWIIAFCNELIRRNLTITWQLPSGTRSEAIDDEVCRLLAATGCKNMAYAPESGSAEIREIIQKRVKIEHMLDSIRAALKHGLSLSCFFVIGFPQDTPKTLRETLRLIRKLAWMGVQDVGVAKFVPYPGSALFKELLESKRIALDDDFFLSPMESYGKGALQISFSDAISPQQLHRWMMRLYLNFYLLSFIRWPLRTLGNIARTFISGVEATRYSRWFRDFFKTRREWRKAAKHQDSTIATNQAHGFQSVGSINWNVDLECSSTRPSAPSSVISLPVLNPDPQEVSVG